ncbi:LacI family DNA-binding transcriptional regulator [Halomonas kalidii]|uniref:LacI family DNA-binding transcriptional regulator n=1 Tax=Halomonas kalidii TaxID=3043293 RepID=A0ABT6VK78_9GAMM|nr:LacI family DNA-binding transcriptional regulator [Halomonas kalidii]MDI5934387.1 LacI family DNA-binding transcriptional regulator [Halomonas kalidii]
MSNQPNTRTRRRRGSAQPTLKEVAEAAGVSSITASRALNTPERVSEAARARVLQAVEQLGYVPNLVAGSLASASSRFIAVIVPSLANAVFIEVINGLQETFEARGYQILLGNTDYDLQREYQLIRTFFGWSCSALVTAGLRHSAPCRTLLEGWEHPIMEVMELGEALDLNVGLDHRDAGRCMARHLLDRGHRAIAFVGAGMAADYRAELRYAGHREVLAGHGLDAPCLDIGRPGGLDGGARGLELALEHHPGITAIHFANDDLAAGALLHAQRLGLGVPERIAIAGFNGLSLGQHVTPRLTTIRSPRHTIGRLAAEEVLRRLDGKSVRRRQHDVGFTLLEGEST